MKNYKFLDSDDIREINFNRKRLNEVIGQIFKERRELNSNTFSVELQKFLSGKYKHDFELIYYLSINAKHNHSYEIILYLITGFGCP